MSSENCDLGTEFFSIIFRNKDYDLQTILEKIFIVDEEFHFYIEMQEYFFITTYTVFN